MEYITLEIIALVLYWISMFNFGYLIGADSIKHFVIGFIFLILGFITYIIIIIIYNPKSSWNLSSEKWTFLILFCIIYFSSSLGLGYLVGLKRS